MAVTTFVNGGRSVVHAGVGGVAVNGPPDVCKTPSPSGPVPIPYPNIAKDADTSKGSVSVTVDGYSIMLKDSIFSTSTGDDAGSVGGVVSGVNKGIAKFLTYSNDIRVEGKNVPRHLDTMLMNGNAPNEGPGTYTGQASGTEDIPDDPCEALRQEIYKLMEEIVKRTTDLRENVGNLPRSGRMSIEGHRDQMAGKQRSLRKKIKKYDDDCPDPPPVGAWERATREVPWPREAGLWGDPALLRNVAVGAGAVGLGYLIYRGIRMLPSLFPPLWPSIPANLAIP